MNLENLLKEVNQFKPTILFNKSEGFIECLYEDTSYTAEQVEEGHEIYYSNDGKGRVVGFRTELKMNENIEVFFK